MVRVFALRAAPAGVSDSISRTTASRSAPSSAANCSWTVTPGVIGASTVNDTGPSIAKSSGPMAVPSGLIPNLSVAASSADSSVRSGTSDST